MILPTYDEAATIRQVVAGVLAHPGVDVLVVDDSSPDGTAGIVRELMAGEPRLRLVERPARSGLASAYLEGFGRALEEGYDLIVEMDSDLSHDPARARRAARGRARSRPPGRREPVRAGWLRDQLEPSPAGLSRMGNIYARLMLGLPLHDATSGYRAYRRELCSRTSSRSPSTPTATASRWSW